MNLGIGRVNLYALFSFVFLASLIGRSNASLGDHLPEFKECVQVQLRDNRPLETTNNHRSVKRKIVRTVIQCYVC
ncbi:hypothetical protein PDIG_59770 [Penicillium digitatum PHI26]|uniref:Secreted protein n=2 Tax=Penicillium digitatum TaxID=36651 RepID=K9G4S8_PEND2|nr:hypothetical protein PDIP_69190 [Penicillium digitatum Pd1]EKV08233.1 hypothetical protein PDIP_69190 [Penicillium digitatum Pd1]EKV09843.1 hypothetical protein PDIG_59770 [Penicillium digitatum PHI26]